jgi:hypothetical protein
MPEDLEGKLINAVATYHDDPLGFVLFAYPWSMAGGPLAAQAGPRQWQRDFLKSIGEQLKSNKTSIDKVIREAVCSGNGPGKSALVGMLISWVMSTEKNTRVIITAGTEPQLKTKTWPEITKWMSMCITSHWFHIEETSISSVDPKCSRSWEVNRVTWNKQRPEAFAGAHNEGRRLMIIFDEASQIDDEIWRVTEGAMTDANTEIFWFVFGNPTRTDGAFFRCFNSNRAYWSRGNPLQIDTRTIEGINLGQINKWLEEYGEDSDFFRIHVRGVFPRTSELQFIPSEFVSDAMFREPNPGRDEPLIMALDVSRGGADFSVFAFRRGCDARSIPWVRLPGSEVRDSNVLIGKACDLAARYKPDYFFVDATGGSVGGPVADQLRRLGYPVTDVQFGAKSPTKEYPRLRGYMWGKMRDWLEYHGCIPKDERLKVQLTSLQMVKHDKDDRLLLESKEDMKARGLESPDDADALAMTFAFPVQSKNRLELLGNAPSRMAKTMGGFMSRVKERAPRR